MSDVLSITKQDQVYGAVVRHVLPDWSIGCLLLYYWDRYLVHLTVH